MSPKDEVYFVDPENSPSFVLKGIRIEQLLPREACRQFSAYRVHIQPGEVKKASFHKNGEELYYVVAGLGSATLGEKDYALRPGCFFRVPPGVLHAFKAEGEALDLLNFHSPPVFSDHDTYFPDDSSEAVST
ncbi:MAG: cupin domain-containing protein [Candidatus Nitrohelix vancouverensis]|uniref:Cupin domain-containing protein n=1 Tax=Candidatus Nitrohelix vancouverensis TaxID=2705534 RepID=A0A7T0G273_9BACT|nr:MAG: cupin domain-containing protein [Candidatus Nitrohelix vancouverensis]